MKFIGRNDIYLVAMQWSGLFLRNRKIIKNLANRQLNDGTINVIKMWNINRKLDFVD